MAGTAYLRFDAIGWGAPFVYHPDEHFVLHPALDVARTGDLNPHWFQYPSLLIYLQAAIVAAVHAVNGAALESNHLANGIGPWDALPAQWPFVLGGRLLVAASAVAGVALLARAGGRLHGSATGLLAGGFLMVCALHNASSHYLTTDVPATTLLIAAMAATAGARPRWLLAGLLAGLAAGTKYTAGIAVLVPALAALDAPLPRETARRWSRTLLGFVAGFLVATPYALLDAVSFWEGLEAQRRNYYAWAGQEGNLAWYVGYLYRDGLGPVITVLAALGLALGAGRALAALWRRRDFGRALAFVVPVLVYVPWIASYPSRAERNLIVVLPFLCLAAADALRRLCALARPPVVAAGLLAALGGAALVFALPPLRSFNHRLTLPDNRTVALAWIREHLPEGTRIVREEYTPQIPRDEYAVDYVFSLARQPYSRYLMDRVEYLVTSSNVFQRSIEPPYIGGEAGREFYRVLFGLPLVKQFPQGPYTPGPEIRIYRVPLSDF